MMEWISVEDRLPNGAIECGIPDNIIIYTIEGEVTTGWIENGGRHWYVIVGDDDIHTEHKRDYVTHWMPLPEPPREV